MAADAAGSWGLKGALYVVDEVAQWTSTAGPKELFEAVTSAAAKRRDAADGATTTVGDPSHWSRKVLDHALADPLWFVHEVRARTLDG